MKNWLVEYENFKTGKIQLKMIQAKSAYHAIKRAWNISRLADEFQPNGKVITYQGLVEPMMMTSAGA